MALAEDLVEVGEGDLAGFFADLMGEPLAIPTIDDRPAAGEED